ncbi:type II secretion system protein GspL [Pseudomonas gessardii]|uniref:type II secretion system protein GspL n=1 Tax=Pseudomonas gessardii TaxID=78544 RepID=UPI00147614A8|nr:type II secretion system protein GspL [Pseudomonas gessardii]NNA67788.1 type II secretion system protein GspL [Pseudomonas gessardii]
MFERLRAKPREWLLVRPPATAEGRWQWLHYSAQQACASGTWPPPSALLQLPGALIIPALDCSHFCLPAPPGLKRHEWPQLFEEYAQQPAEALLVSCLSREAGQLELLVMQRQQVQQWLAECAALGLQITHGWAELQLLPPPEAGQVVEWRRAQVRCLKAHSRQWLVWPPVLGERLPQAWRDLPAETLEGDWPSRLARLEQVPSVLENTRPARPQRAPLMSGMQRRLLLGCVVLAACWSALYLGQSLRQIEGWKAQVRAVTGPANSPQQARAALARVQAEASDWQVRQQKIVALEQAFSAWLQQQPGWSVVRIELDDSHWRLALRGNGPRPLPAEWQAMAQAAGAQWLDEAQSAAGQLHLTFELGEQP